MFFKTSGYFRNEINSGYGRIGFTNTNSNSGDGLASPEKGIGLVFHGGGGGLKGERTLHSGNPGDRSLTAVATTFLIQQFTI